MKSHQFTVSIDCSSSILLLYTLTLKYISIWQTYLTKVTINSVGLSYTNILLTSTFRCKTISQHSSINSQFFDNLRKVGQGKRVLQRIAVVLYFVN